MSETILKGTLNESKKEKKKEKKNMHATVAIHYVVYLFVSPLQATESVLAFDYDYMLFFFHFNQAFSVHFRILIFQEYVDPVLMF